MYPGSQLAVGDFNGDGIQDVAVTSGTSGFITVLLGNGSGGFTVAPGDQPFISGAPPFPIAVGDFNGDGIQDLVTASEGSSNVTIFLGNALRRI